MATGKYAAVMTDRSNTVVFPSGVCSYQTAVPNQKKQIRNSNKDKSTYFMNFLLTAIVP
jgi:hypothetical protein